MMTCDELAKFFNDFLDKELSSEDLKHMEEHLAMCPDCSGHMNFDKALRQFVQKKSMEGSLPPQLKESILKKLKSG